MDFDIEDNRVVKYPATNASDGKKIYDHIINNNVEHILEIGTAHGKSACYMAAALHALGRGTVTTLDIPAAQNYKPNVFAVAEEADLSEFINPVFHPNGSHWLLRILIIENSKDEFASQY